MLSSRRWQTSIDDKRLILSAAPQSLCRSGNLHQVRKSQPAPNKNDRMRLDGGQGSKAASTCVPPPKSYFTFILSSPLGKLITLPHICYKTSINSVSDKLCYPSPDPATYFIPHLLSEVLRYVMTRKKHAHVDFEFPCCNAPLPLRPGTESSSLSKQGLLQTFLLLQKHSKR